MFMLTFGLDRARLRSYENIGLSLIGIPFLLIMLSYFDFNKKFVCLQTYNLHT